MSADIRPASGYLRISAAGFGRDGLWVFANIHSANGYPPFSISARSAADFSGYPPLVADYHVHMCMHACMRSMVCMHEFEF